MTVDGRQTEIVSTSQSLTRKAQYHNRLLSLLISGVTPCQVYTMNSAHRHNQAALNEGNVVLLKNEGIVCCLWKLAKIVELFQGSNGAVRPAKVKVLNTERLIVFLYCPIQYL